MESFSYFPLTSLPPKILPHIFSHFTWKERLDACLVCKNWLQLINRKCLLRDIEVRLTNNEGIALFMSMTRNFVNFDFNTTHFNKSCCQLLKRISPYVEYLCISMDQVDEPYPVDEASFDNLMELDVNLPGDWWHLFSSLPNLYMLSIQSCTRMTDYGLSILQKSLKNLKILEIHSNVECNPEVYMKFYSKGFTHETNPSSEILSFPAVKSFISASNTLSELKMYEISASALKELSCVKNLNLKRFQLMYFKSECGGSFSSFFKAQQNLKQLHLADTDLNNNTIDALVIFLSNLKCLHLWDCSMTDKSLIALCKLEQLKIMDIQYCKGTTTEGRHDAISNLTTLQRNFLDYQEVDSGRFCLYFSI